MGLTPRCCHSPPPLQDVNRGCCEPPPAPQFWLQRPHGMFHPPQPPARVPQMSASIGGGPQQGPPPILHPIAPPPGHPNSCRAQRGTGGDGEPSVGAKGVVGSFGGARSDTGGSLPWGAGGSWVHNKGGLRGGQGSGGLIPVGLNPNDPFFGGGWTPGIPFWGAGPQGSLLGGAAGTRGVMRSPRGLHQGLGGGGSK